MKAFGYLIATAALLTTAVAQTRAPAPNSSLGNGWRYKGCFTYALPHCHQAQPTDAHQRCEHPHRPLPARPRRLRSTSPHQRRSDLHSYMQTARLQIRRHNRQPVLYVVLQCPPHTRSILMTCRVRQCHQSQQQPSCRTTLSNWRCELPDSLFVESQRGLWADQLVHLHLRIYCKWIS